jgi:hypothetical protein
LGEEMKFTETQTTISGAEDKRLQPTHEIEFMTTAIVYSLSITK